MAPTVKASELFREKVVARYYSAYTNLPKPDTDVSNESSSHFEPRSSKDTALTAFAQLTALRLNTARALISLIDSRNHYILAEATKSLSLQSDLCHDDYDGLWLGAVNIPRNEGICELILDHSPTTEPEDGKGDGPEVFAISDLREVSRFAGCSYVLSGPKVRFVAGVPLRAADGTKVGVLCALDDKVRTEISPEQKTFFHDMRKTIMDHLDGVRVQAEYKRRDKLVNGLESFIDGLSELRTATDGPQSRRTVLDRQPDRVAQNDVRTEDHTQNQEEGDNSSDMHSEDLDALDTGPKALWEKALPSGTKKMFTRASKIIRQAGNYDGVAFLYVSTNSRSDNMPRSQFVPTSQALEQRTSSDSSLSASSTGISDIEPGVLGASISPQDSLTDETELSDGSAISPPCPVIAYSLSEAEAIVQAAYELPFINYTQRDMERVFGKKPKGRVFLLNEQGFALSGDTSSSGSSAEQAASSTKKSPASWTDTSITPVGGQKHMARVKAIRKLSENARSFTSLPLWDVERNRWFAHCICWSATPNRDPSLDGDLHYLRIFGNSIMNALSHIDALAADHAKTTFVSSISHELRTPLHGILGANNFLMDTQLSCFQEEMASSISSCGRTLLDTVEHVMDFAKINSFSVGNEAKRKRATSRTQIRRLSGSVGHANGLTSTAVDLNLLVEEVVEAVVMGFAIQHDFLYNDEKPGKSLDFIKSKAATNNIIGTLPNSAQRGRVRIALQLPSQQTTLVNTEPGAWRRIVMNLFGNALKYTSDGLITVRLDINEGTGKQELLSASFTVSDTGRGISNEYLQKHLYRPFSQEDTFSSGTGLGLSIVNQIVRTMGGKIDLSSSKGVGTNVKVDAHLSGTKHRASAAQAPEYIPEVIGKMRGMRVCLLEDAASRASTEQDTVQLTAESGYSESLLALLRDWFKVEASVKQSWVPGSADIVVCLEPSFKHLASVRQLNESQITPPVILIAYDALEMAALRADARILSSESIVEVICQPIGPRKLAKSLNQCLDRRATGRPANSTHSEDHSEIASDPSMSSTRAHSQASQTSAELVPSPIGHDTSGPCILICDDNPINLRLLAAFVKKAKIQHEEAGNGQEALDQYIAAKGKFQFVFMDISMPVMDGITASRMIRKHEREESLPRTPIIALTGLASAASRSEAFEADIDEFMTKPISFERLQKYLERYPSD